MPIPTTPRVLAAHIARRFIRLATIVAIGIFTCVVGLSAALVYFFSPWWWLLLIPFVALLAVFLVLRLILSFVVRSIYRESPSNTQKAALNDFSDKVMRLVEARGMPPIFLAVITLKDLVFHRDITTIKGLINDTASLKRDYQALEKLF